MRGKIFIIHPDGTAQGKFYSTPIPDGDLQKAVGGHIETVPFFDRFNGSPCVAFCNSDGKNDGMEPNNFATMLWYMQVSIDDYLVGSVAIVTGDDAFMRAL